MRENHFGEERITLEERNGSCRSREERKMNKMPLPSPIYIYALISHFLLFPYHFVMLSLASSHQPTHPMVHLSQIRRLKRKISHLVQNYLTFSFGQKQCNGRGHNITRTLHCLLQCHAETASINGRGDPNHSGVASGQSAHSRRQ